MTCDLCGNKANTDSKYLGQRHIPGCVEGTWRDDSGDSGFALPAHPDGLDSVPVAPCAERMDSFPFTSDHLWHQDIHGIPTGQCYNCGEWRNSYMQRAADRQLVLQAAGVFPGIAVKTPLAKKIAIKVSVLIDGLHHWPTANAKVPFLRNPHRHLFKITVTLDLTCSREHEFFITQDVLLTEILTCGVGTHKEGAIVSIDFGDKSCEQIASVLLDVLHEQKHPIVSVEVSEDGENSAVVSVA